MRWHLAKMGTFMIKKYQYRPELHLRESGFENKIFVASANGTWLDG